MLLVTLVALLGVAAVDGQCSGTPLLVTLDGTVISSPGYNGADGYPINQNCEWLIQTGGNLRGVSLDISTVFIENCPSCACDSLAVYDGPNATSPLLGSFCGAPSMPVTLDAGNSMFVTFTSDATFYDTTTGFQATVRFNNLACDGGTTVTEPSGWLTSPNFPENYPGLSNCQWNFVAPTNQRIEISFIEFHLEGSTCGIGVGPGVQYDAVQFTENDGQTELGRWFGYHEYSNGFKFQNYDSNMASVRFISDATTDFSGFNMTWRFVDA